MEISRPGGVAALLVPRLPFFYGWIILACACCAGFARQGPAVATLSIFVEPMISSFRWSHTALSGAVSLGGIMAALVSPLIGPLLDRQGARVMLCTAVLVTGFSTMLLSLIHSLTAFYVFFCIARLNFAGPFEIGIYGAPNSWFIRRRPLATSIANLAQMGGLVALPLIAHRACQREGWRARLAGGGSLRAAGWRRACLAFPGAAARTLGWRPTGCLPPPHPLQDRSSLSSRGFRAGRRCARPRSGYSRSTRQRSFPCRRG